MDETIRKTQELSGRINQIRQYFCNGVNTDFACKIGKEPAYTSQLCTGTKSIGNKIIEKILDTFPEVSKTWLLLGEGDMIVDPLKQVVVDARDNATVNSISHTGANNTNSINASGELNAMYEARLADKDALIEYLKKSVEHLSNEVKELREWTHLCAGRYIDTLDEIKTTTASTNEIVKEASQKIGFKQK